MKYLMALAGMICLILGGSNLEYAYEFCTHMPVVPWIVAGIILNIPLFYSAIRRNC